MTEVELYGGPLDGMRIRLRPIDQIKRVEIPISVEQRTTWDPNEADLGPAYRVGVYEPKNGRWTWKGWTR